MTELDEERDAVMYRILKIYTAESWGYKWIDLQWAMPMAVYEYLRALLGPDRKPYAVFIDTDNPSPPYPGLQETIMGCAIEIDDALQDITLRRLV